MANRIHFAEIFICVCSTQAVRLAAPQTKIEWQGNVTHDNDYETMRGHGVKIEQLSLLDIQTLGWDGMSVAEITAQTDLNTDGDSIVSGNELGRYCYNKNIVAVTPAIEAELSDMLELADVRIEERGLFERTVSRIHQELTSDSLDLARRVRRKSNNSFTLSKCLLSVGPVIYAITDLCLGNAIPMFNDEDWYEAVKEVGSKIETVMKAAKGGSNDRAGAEIRVSDYIGGKKEGEQMMSCMDDATKTFMATLAGEAWETAVKAWSKVDKNKNCMETPNVKAESTLWEKFGKIFKEIAKAGFMDAVGFAKDFGAGFLKVCKGIGNVAAAVVSLSISVWIAIAVHAIRLIFKIKTMLKECSTLFR